MKSLVLFLEIYCISHVVMSVRLSPSGVYSVCPGEEVIYRCIIPGVSVLRWIIRPSPIEANVEFVFTSSMTELQMASISGVIFVARVDSTNPSFNSTLTTTASQSFVSDGIMIECTSGGVTNSSTLNINGHPETIQNLSSTEEYTSGYMYTNTIINWSSPDGVDTTFIVSIDPPLPSGSFFTTSGRSLQLMIPYNINYTISIVGSNCIGNSSTAELQIGYTQVLCPKLNISENATVLWNENRASTISGSNVTIQCLPGFAPTYKRTFTCDTNGMWKPDLEMFKCYVNCGQPTPPNNVHLEMPNGTTEGSWILIKCNNGNNTTSAVCDSDGRWLPDPSQHYSNCESSTRVTVKGTMTSESTVLYASIPLVLVVIICSVLLLIIIMCIKSNKGKSSRDSSNTRADDHELQSEVIVNEPRVNVEPEYEEVVVVKEPQVNEELEKNVAYKGHNDIKVRENVAYERKDNIKPVENVAAAYKWHNDIKVRENVVYGINNNQLKLVENVAYDGQVHLELIKNAAYGTL